MRCSRSVCGERHRLAQEGTDSAAHRPSPAAPRAGRDRLRATGSMPERQRALRAKRGSDASGITGVTALCWTPSHPRKNVFSPTVLGSLCKTLAPSLGGRHMRTADSRCPTPGSWSRSPPPTWWTWPRPPEREHGSPGSCQDLQWCTWRLRIGGSWAGSGSAHATSATEADHIRAGCRSGCAEPFPASLRLLRLEGKMGASARRARAALSQLS